MRLYVLCDLPSNIPLYLRTIVPGTHDSGTTVGCYVIDTHPHTYEELRFSRLIIELSFEHCSCVCFYGAMWLPFRTKFSNSFPASKAIRRSLLQSAKSTSGAFNTVGFREFNPELYFCVFLVLL